MNSPRRRCAHALRCLDHCEANGLTHRDLAYAYKGAGKDPDAQAYKKPAAEVLIAEADDREHLEEDLAAL